MLRVAFVVALASAGLLRRAQNVTTLALAERSHMARPWTVKEVCHIASQYLPAPDLCPQGADYFTRDALLAMVPEFTKLRTAQQEAFKNTPHCCMGTNHQFAVFSSIKKLAPKAVIESGVAAGHGTWLLRNLVGPEAPIFSLDPVGPDVQYPPVEGQTFVGYRDPSPNTHYLTDAKFQDFATVDWGALIPDPAVRAQTFVLLDDHQSAIERLKVIRKWGFRFVFYEDNYSFSSATMADTATCSNLDATVMPRTADPQWLETRGDCYSFNALCQSPTPGVPFVLEKDKFGYECRMLTPAAHTVNVQYMQASLESYFEFPALFTPCPTAPRPALFDATQLLAAGLPAASSETTYGEDIWTYMGLYPALAILHPGLTA